MRFRFCGYQDCPDWVLSEVAVVSKLTSVKLKLLCQQMIKSLVNSSDDPWSSSRSEQLAKLPDTGNTQGCISVVHFLIESAFKHSCSSDDFERELDQVGLPHEHASCIARVYADSLPSLRANRKPLRFLPTVKISSSTQRTLPSTGGKYAQLELTCEGTGGSATKMYNVALNEPQLRSLVTEMNIVRNRLEQLVPSAGAEETRTK